MQKLEFCTFRKAFLNELNRPPIIAEGQLSIWPEQFTRVAFAAESAFSGLTGQEGVAVTETMLRMHDDLVIFFRQLCESHNVIPVFTGEDVPVPTC